ncbi:30S ribosomal protein S8e [Candidatus Woesearchaeota archaeon]|nr:30S ribosomal protein S8e [Candidatus Woesearchaeota archaeon]
MAITQERPKRKVSGGRYRDLRKKRLRDTGRLPAYTRIEKRNSIFLRTMGGNSKQAQLSSNIANVYDPSSKKYTKTKILTVVHSEANRHFVRRNIMTKGAVIKTEIGDAKITSRPGQEGAINAVLIKK